MRKAREARELILARQVLNLDKIVECEIEDAIKEGCFEREINVAYYERETVDNIIEVYKIAGYTVTCEKDDNDDTLLIIKF